MLSEGDKAPDFELPGDREDKVRLPGLKGKAAVLFFYPKDNTSGCTKEAIGFSERSEEFAARRTSLSRRSLGKCVDISRPGCEACQRHVFDHTLTQRCHHGSPLELKRRDHIPGYRIDTPYA